MRFRRSPRKHKVREHGRGKPTGGRANVDEYQRGREGSTGPGPSAGGRAQVRASFLKTRDARVARARAKKLARAAKKKSERRVFVETARRKGGDVLDHALGVEPDAFGDEKAEKAEKEE